MAKEIKDSKTYRDGKRRISEQELRFVFIENSATWDSIKGKISNDLKGIHYVCHTFGPQKYHGTEYVSDEAFTIKSWIRK